MSQKFTLRRTQGSLDFVDVELRGDTRLFINPRAFLALHGDWAANATYLVQKFFTRILQCIRDAQDPRALELLSHLREPNETRLGFSNGPPRGHGVGEGLAEELYSSLKGSEAVQTGLLEDLEDTLLVVEGVGPDLISDITTNLVRSLLIEYTQEQCAALGIPVERDVDSGPLWDGQREKWSNEHVELPVVDNRKLLLVPKAIVRRRMEYDPGEYFRDYILTSWQEEELTKLHSPLVTWLKSGKAKVYKKDLQRARGGGKGAFSQKRCVNRSS